MSDLISREDAMAFPLSWENRDKEHGSDEFIAGVECYRDYIEGLPSAQREFNTALYADGFADGYKQGKKDTQRWIPVSERLPDKGQMCLVCDEGVIAIDKYLGIGNPLNWDWYDRDYEAWMPLPEPYKGE